MLASHPRGHGAWKSMKASMPDQARLLLRIHEALRGTVRFGYRVANEIAAFGRRPRIAPEATMCCRSRLTPIMQISAPNYTNAAQLAAFIDALLGVREACGGLDGGSAKNASLRVGSLRSSMSRAGAG